jgi:cell division protein FtsL
MIKTGKDKVKNIIKENEDLKEIKKSSFKDILTGDILNRKFIQKQFPLLILSLCFIFIYMDNRIRCEQQIIQIDALNKELANEKYICMVTEAEILKNSRIEQVKEIIKQHNLNLEEESLPPYKVTE